MAFTKNNLTKTYQKKGITQCELHLEGCWRYNTLSFAHRHKRRYYKGTDMLWTFNQTILACIPCHQKIEYDSDLTEEIFEKLRGEDLFV